MGVCFQSYSSTSNDIFFRYVTRGGRGVYPALFQKLENTALSLGKKHPDYGHIYVKFLI